MNAGFLPAEHWTQGPEGGGRLLGEACHIVDLFRSLVGHPVKAMHCAPLRGSKPGAKANDNFTLTLEYEDGSVATLLYTAQGHRDVSKERMEVFFDQKVFVMDDYLTMSAHGMPKASIELKQRDKGHAAELAAFRDAAISGERFPIPWDELVETWRITWQADELCRKG
jgi:predicted dehydrogenase